ncbi:hypothetical protein BDF21DRAFT_420038 [Thamnidium elegans]|nr:hypothetical protein BDF21DRAFT_420038 [Thamnidium elegans]
MIVIMGCFWMFINNFIRIFMRVKFIILFFIITCISFLAILSFVTYARNTLIGFVFHIHTCFH